MPPRKSDASKVATGDEGTPAKDQPIREGVNIEDLNLPKSIVTRLAKGVLPPNTQIQGNAMLAMTKSATVFINYLTTHSNEHAISQNRKTIAPQDVFKALEELEFPEFRPRLEAELQKFSEVQSDKRNTYRKKVAADKASGKAGAGEGEDGEVGEMEGHLDRDGQPAAKKARRETGGSVGDESSEMREGDMMGDPEDDEGDEEEDQGDDAEDDDQEEEEEEEEETGDVEEEEEEAEEREVEDEALDNGEDSD